MRKAVKSMKKPRLALVTPSTVYGTVDSKHPPRRRRNAEPREYLIDAEVNRLIAVAGDNRNGHRDATMVLVAYRHGLRAAEVVTVRWDAIDFNHGRLHVSRIKSSADSVLARIAAVAARARAEVAVRFYIRTRCAFQHRRLAQDGGAARRRRRFRRSSAPAHVAARLRLQAGE
jgi:integrase